MKKIATFLTTVLASVSFSLTAFAAPLFAPIEPINFQPIDMGAALEASIMANISCSMEATIKFVDTSKNTVTYSINYTNKNDSTVKKPYGLQAGTNAELLINATGEATLAKATSGKVVLPSGKTVGSFTVNPKTTTKVTFNANINGKKCTTKELTPVKTMPIINPIVVTPAIGSIDLSGAAVSPVAPAANASGVIVFDPNAVAAAQENNENAAHTCKIIAEGTLRGTTVLMGAAIDYDGYAAKNFPFTIRGFSESKPNEIREYKGTKQLSTGKNYLLNSDNHGFLFELPLSANPETYNITATLGGTECALASFAIPSINATAAAQNGGSNGGTLAANEAQANSTVEAFGTSPQDAQIAAQLALAQNATNDGAQDVQNSASTNVLLVLGGVVLAGLGFGIYKKFSTKI